jgi:hypothetical protein
VPVDAKKMFSWASVREAQRDCLRNNRDVCGRSVPFTIEKILDLLEIRSPAGLVSAESFAHIKSLGRLLPNGITYGLGFESRLANPSPEVDFILRPLAPHGLAIIADLDAGQGPPTLMVQSHNWQRLRNLCRSCGTPGSPLHESIFCLWIEFDSEHYSQAVVSPSLVFVQLQRPCCSPERYESIAQAMYMSLKGLAMPPALIQNLHRCIERMPERGLMTLFGLPVARQTEAFRVVVGELEPDEIPEYVSSVGWKGRSKELESLIFALGGYADRHSINFDLDEQGIGKVGIEFAIPQEHALTSDPRWEIILDFLVKQGWCRKEKRDSLLSWPKLLTLAHGDSKPFLLRRFISHIKLSLEDGRRVAAKAYVGLVW